MKRLNQFLLILSMLFSLQVTASDLNDIAIFYRCYSQITQKFPDPQLSQIAAVKAGKDPITACLEIFDSASFANKTHTLKAANVNDDNAKAVLKTMHTLHFSWFAMQFYPEIASQYLTNVNNILDSSSPASFLTKSLFDNASPMSDIVSGTVSYRPIRVFENVPNAPYNGTAIADYIFTNVKFASVGNLLGFEILPVDDTLDYSFDENQNPPESIITGTLTYNKHFGGGLMGHQTYLIQNIKSNTFNPTPDGGVKTMRNWSRSVFNDLLCRALPAVRESDGASFVDLQSSITFRNSQSCVKCHTSMDQMAGVVRGAVYSAKVGKFFNPGHSAFIEERTPTQPSADIFPTAPDPAFRNRPPEGRLYYRTHNGTLVDQAVSNLQDLGTKIAAQDDMYNCMAKRYYQFFTGIDGDIGDIADPHHGTLSSEELVVRGIILNLGQQLKTHQNSRVLIETILRRPEYKKSNFNVGGF
ncbi:MAG: hypothetical protein HN576_04870 [Bacteriovoracaceae bacterium]|jgi:hypothetical protein|nr:hypothetical protein [Bacteriovoracaceae bacterium]